MKKPKNRRPGDLILERYMPDASEEEREEARANLKAYVALVLRLQERAVREGDDYPSGDKNARTNPAPGLESDH